MQPSASKTDLLLRCGWVFDNDAVQPPVAAPADDADPIEVSDADEATALETVRDPELPTRWGLAFHELHAAMLEAGPNGNVGSMAIGGIAARFGVDRGELVESVTASYTNLIAWLREANPFQINFLAGRKMLVEQPLAYAPLTSEARTCEPADSETHRYPDRQPHELPGTLDICVLPADVREFTGKGIRYYARANVKTKRASTRLGRTLLLGDHKTGYPAAGKFEPNAMGQLWSLGAAAVRVYDADDVILFVNHAPRDGAPTIYCSDVITRAELQNFEKRLRIAWRRKNDGSLRPGPHCDQLYCPARFPTGAGTPDSVCPSRRTMLAEMGLVQLRTSGGPGALLLETPEQIGRAHERLAEVNRMATGVKNVIREAVQRVGYGVTEKGVLAFRTTEPRMSLSRAAMERLKGKSAAAMKITELDKDGWIEWKAREELRVKAE